MIKPIISYSAFNIPVKPSKRNLSNGITIKVTPTRKPRNKLKFLFNLKYPLPIYN